MNTKKLMLATAMTALTGLYGCSEGDDSSVNITAEGGDPNTGGQLSQGCPSWTTPKQQDADGNNVCALPSTIEQDRTLTNDIVWLMEGRVTVGNGNGQMSATEGTLENGDAVLDVTLAIQPGTEVKGATGTFANLIITRGSKIDANGEESNPIIFSSDDAGYDGTGEWGGLILHGYGLHNNADDTCSGGPCQNVDAEGESGFAGGSTADDDSGRLRYVIVTEGGYEFAPGNEINGISFVAVGSGTTVENIQVNSNADDGVEFYGGNVDAKYLLLTGNLDDSVDWDEAYQGDIQYVMVIQSDSTEGNAIEADTEGSATPLSKPTIANATFVGAGEQDTLLVFKESSGGFLHHSVLTATASDPSTITCEDTSEATTTSNALVFTNTVGDCTPDGTGNGNPSITAVGDVQLDSNYAAQNSSATGVGALDIAGFNSGNAESVADPAFFDATEYAGAVDPSASAPWWSVWALESSVPAN